MAEPYNNAVLALVSKVTKNTVTLSSELLAEVGVMMESFDLDERGAVPIERLPTLLTCLKICRGSCELADIKQFVKKHCEDKQRVNAEELVLILKDKLNQERLIDAFIEGMELLDPFRKGYISCDKVVTLLEALKEVAHVDFQDKPILEVIAPWSVFEYKEADLKKVIREFGQV
jgi:Ca2+-binding EF-hand superfamily protein